MPAVKTVSLDLQPPQPIRPAASLESIKQRMLANALLGKAASDTSPVYSHGHGMAKLAAGGLAGLDDMRAMNDLEESKRETAQRLAKLLDGMGGEGGVPGLNGRSVADMLADPNVPESLKAAAVARIFAKPDPRYGAMRRMPGVGWVQDGPNGQVNVVRGEEKSGLLSPEEEDQQVRIHRAKQTPELLPDDVESQRIRMAQAGRSETNVNIDQKADSKFAQTMAEGLGKTFNKMIDDGMSAQADLSLVDQMEELQKRVPTGGGAAMKAALGSWGIRGEGLSDIEAYQSVINRLIPKQRDGLPGSTSDKDLALLAGAVPRLINTPEGNAIIMNTMRSGIENRIARGDIATRLAMGTIDDKQAMTELKSLPNPLARFLAYEQERLKATSPTPGAPAAAAAPNAQGTTSLSPRPTPQQALEILRQRELQRQQQQGVVVP